MLTSIVRKKFPVTTLLRAIGYETDKDILDLFGLAEDVKVSKAGLKNVRKKTSSKSITFMD